MAKKPMAESTVAKIRKVFAEQKAKQVVETVPVQTAPVTGNLAIEQPDTTKEHDLAIRGVPESESKKPGFVEPAFDGLFWKQDGSLIREDGTKAPGWYTQRMWDGSYNIVEER